MENHWNVISGDFLLKEMLIFVRKLSINKMYVDMNDKVLFRNESYNLIGAAMAVHSELGCGFTEPIYQEAFEKELLWRHIPFEREKTFKVYYKGAELSKRFVPDFFCYGKIIVELKAVSDLIGEHHSQVYNYLKASGLGLGLLINFGKTSLDYKRIPCTTKFVGE